MKRILFIAFLALAALAVTSCTATKGGCKQSQGMIGYGSR